MTLNLTFKVGDVVVLSPRVRAHYTTRVSPGSLGFVLHVSFFTTEEGLASDTVWYDVFFADVASNFNVYHEDIYRLL